MSEMPFDENIAESRKVVELKKDGLHWFILFVFYTSFIKKSYLCNMSSGI